MLKNYLVTAIRSLFKQKGYSVLNVFGLAVGMASCLLLLLFVRDELSYDRYHNKADRIFRVGTSVRMGGRDSDVAVAPAPAGPTMVQEFPEVENACRFRQQGDWIVRTGERSFRENRVTFADHSFFDLFSIPLTKGDSASALKEPNCLVMSRKAAEKYFRDEDPLGKTLRLDDRSDYLVTGVFEEIPAATHFHYDFLLSMSTLAEGREPFWLSMNFQTYLLLREGSDPAALEAKFPGFVGKYMGPQLEEAMGQPVDKLFASGDLLLAFFLQKLTDIHLRSDLIAEMEPNSDIAYIYIFSAIALFILGIAAINFMNLATARSSGRAKEVGIRKVMGSLRVQLIRQFLTESVLLSLISLLLAVGLAALALPGFNLLAGKTMSLAALGEGSILAAMLTIVLLTGLLAGSYPAFFISAFQPVNTLKGKARAGVRTGVLRSSLVIFQFTVSVVLIVGTMVVYNQLHFIQNKKLGFDKDQVIVLQNTYLLRDRAQAFKEAALQLPDVENATVSGFLPVPTTSRDSSAVFPEGDVANANTTSIQVWQVDFDYIDTLKLHVLQGRGFSREFSADNEAALLNESAVRQFNLDKPLGARLSRFISNDGDIASYTVIGVVEDFHFDSLRATIGPLIMFLGNSNSRISFRVKTRDLSGVIAGLRAKWKEFLPNQTFEFGFLDEQFFSVYKAERRIGSIFGVFAGLAVFIGCLGLFGLAAFTAERRTKEIGIRKVLGATVPNLIRLLSREFVLLVGIANLIAWPLAFFAMRGWLQDFAYRSRLGLWMFAGAALLTLVIALATVSIQAVKAALADPITSLRYE